jgi:hypothetical protein
MIPKFKVSTACLIKQTALEAPQKLILQITPLSNNQKIIFLVIVSQNLVISNMNKQLVHEYSSDPE